MIEASGLRGRGGAGFPTGKKWRTVSSHRSGSLATSVVVNAAEGEPGTFKDRTIIRRNPFKLLEGALIACRAVGANRIFVGTKEHFHIEVARLLNAVDEVVAAGWAQGVTIEVVRGPSSYLLGEETALLEVIDERAPFPRIAPPYRHGVQEVGLATGYSGQIVMASRGTATEAPPTLVNNVETMSNIASILAHGPDWFREVGTADSPGTIVCTVSGHTTKQGVGEVPMGLPLRRVLERIGGGPHAGREWTVMMPGVSNPLLLAEKFDTPVSYEALAAAGSGLGSGSFIVFDDTLDPVALAYGVSRFLSIESCGQCTPCKKTGMKITEHLDALRQSKAKPWDVNEVKRRIPLVNESARCYIGHQQRTVLESILGLFPEAFEAHGDGRVPGAEPEAIIPILDIVDGTAVYDVDHWEKQPDWTFGVWSGASPVELLGHKIPEQLYH